MIVVLGLSVPAKAFPILELRGTDTLGNRLIYDPDLDITWYDFSNTANTWFHQVAWAGALSVDFGNTIIDDWRLPTALNQDGSGPEAGPNFANSVMGHLYFTELGNVAGGGLANIGDFQNLINGPYWSGTEFEPGSVFAWGFNFSNGNSKVDFKSHNFSALAVRSGDVQPPIIPEPATIALLGIGLAGLAGAALRRKLKKRTIDKSR